MLQWKPQRFYAALTLAALCTVAVFGGYAGDTGDTLRQSLVLARHTAA